MIVWILISIFGLLSILFFIGKGGFLIAGYNTASEEEKSQYDEKKLCFVMGIGMSVITISLLVAIIYEKIAALVLIGGIFIAIAIMTIGTNLFCINKESKVFTGKTNRIGKWVSLIIGTIICGSILIFMIIGDVSISFNNTSITTSAFLTRYKTVDYKDIQSITYRKDMDKGRREMGVGTYTISAGRFENDEFGEYYLYAYARCDEYIVIDTKNGYVVVNDSNARKTEQLYNKIQEKVKENLLRSE